MKFYQKSSIIYLGQMLMFAALSKIIFGQAQNRFGHIKGQGKCLTRSCFYSTNNSTTFIRISSFARFFRLNFVFWIFSQSSQMFINHWGQRFNRKDNQRQRFYYVSLIRACLNFDQFDHQSVYMGKYPCIPIDDQTLTHL